MKKNDFEDGNREQVSIMPNDPEFSKLLRRVFEIDSPHERDETSEAIKKDEDKRKTYEGIKLIKAEMGFNTFEEYVEWVENKKKAFHYKISDILKH
jgi:hypothetical protein